TMQLARHCTQTPSFLPSLSLLPPPPPTSTLFPYTTLFRSYRCARGRTRPTCAAFLPFGVVGTLPPECDSRALVPVEGGLGCSIRSEEHTSELQSHLNLVCRLLLEKKKKKKHNRKLLVSRIY